MLPYRKNKPNTGNSPEGILVLCFCKMKFEWEYLKNVGGDNKYITAEHQKGIQLKDRPVIRTSRYSLGIQTSSFQPLLSVELPQRPEQEICAQLLPLCQLT